MPLNPPKPRRKKNNECQQFSRDVLGTWQERLEYASENKQGFLELFQASTQQGQLAALKKIGPSLAQPTLGPAHEAEAVLCTLVEVHSQCSSRHPLQRAIASLLQSQSVDSIRLVVKEHIGKTLETVLGAAGTGSDNGLIDTQLKAVHYFEVLMENFPLGQETVESHLPLLLHFIDSTMVSYKAIQQEQSASMAVLLALIKTTTSLLLKTSLQLHRMLTEDVEGVCWPRDCQEKGKWIGEKLAALLSNSEEILSKSDSMPHDMTVSAAMLLVATLNITLGLLPSFKQDHIVHSPPSQLVHRIQRYWLSFSPFARLSLCHALLAKLPIVVVTNVELEGQPLLVALFQYITHLSNSLSESSKRYIASRTLALWTSVARECVCGTEAGSPLSLSLAPSGPIMQTLLQYIWSLWEDPIDGIRHQCRDMFENIIKTYKHLQQSGGDFLLELAETLLYTDAPTRGRYILLSSLSPHVPPESILRVSPQLPQQLIAVMGHQALACHAGDLWSRLVALHWLSVVGNEEEETKWSKVWLLPLVSTMCGEDQLALKHITQHCLPTLFQCSNKSLHLIMTQFKSIPENTGPSNVLTAQLACFRSAKAHLKEGLSQLDHLYSPEDIFKKAMGHADEQVRLSALGLLCESRRTTEPPQPHLLPHLFSFLELNANSQAPGFRYSVLTSIKKLFIRIRDSCYALSKAFQKSRGMSENPDKLVAKYLDFLRTLLKQHFSVLHPLSSYQRRHFSLSLLQTMAVIFSPVQDATIPPIFDFTMAVSGEHARTLVECLRDPFDANRVMCLELLYKLDTAKMGLNKPDYLLQCVESYVSLACSPKSVNCTSASYLLKLLTHLSCVQFNTILSQQLGLQVPLLSNGEDPIVSTLLLLCQLLRDHMTSAKADLVQASISSPMYGLLQSIRTILETLKPTTAARDVVRGVVDICVQISELVSPVVCSSSPEGFLPSQEQEIGLLSQGTVGNAQSLLLCCWHSMKEISLLLGFLAGELPVICDTNEEGMLSQDQVEMISEVFIHQLTEARHRGAFEIAYTGFCKLCRCLWSSPYPSLSKKPLLWIQDLLDSLQTSSMARLLSITRRSAGLPFYVQAILTSEPSYTSYSCLKYTLQTLLKVARSGLSSSVTTPTDSPLQSEPAAVHALNILRSLYRESKLGDLVVPFIPDGVMIAIEGFSASLWPVRNSSTLLFSALFSRVFGAKRVQDEHSMENKMTAREFFTRFPPLYDFLLDQLRSSATELLGSSGQLLQPSLFPSLLLLSRLYPSPLDDDHTPYSLHLFIPYLLTCTRCPVWKTRVLVSRALSSLTTPSNLPLLLTELYDRLNMADQNCLHGSLLTLRLLLTEKKELLCATGERTGWMLGTHLEKSYIASINNPCGLTAHLYLDILHSLLELTTPILPSIPRPQLETVKTLLSSSYDHCFKTSDNALFSANLTEVHFRLLLLSANHYDKFKPVLTDCPNLKVNELLCTTITTQNIVLRQHGLKALCSMSQPLTESDEGREVIIARVLELVQLETESETLTKAYQFLAKDGIRQQDTITKVFPSAHQLCLKPTNTLELRLALIQFISKAISLLSQNKKKTLTNWISYLKEVSVPTQPFEIRQCVAKQLAELWVCALGDCAPLVTLCNLVVALLQDSDEDVRTQAAQSVTKILSGGIKDCVQSMQPSRALRMFISHALPNSEIAFDVLISLLSSLVEEATLLSILNKHTATKDTPSQANNVLFDEDPINDYAEDILVMQLVVNALTDNGPFSVAQLSQLADLLPCLVNGGRRDKGKSPWEDLGVFKTKTKLTVLAPLFEAVRLWISKDTCTSALSECLCTLDELSIA